MACDREHASVWQKRIRSHSAANEEIDKVETANGAGEVQMRGYRVKCVLLIFLRYLIAIRADVAG
jgi:hypothetical protein